MKRKTILITGSEGAIGRYLCPAIKNAGYDIRTMDTRSKFGFSDDIRCIDKLGQKLSDCAGIINLAAVSRVEDAEKNPVLCRDVNTKAVETICEFLMQMDDRPWLMAFSSREVYGDVKSLPVHESSPFAPINIYGKSKSEMEELLTGFRDKGLKTAIVRLSNVYGNPMDHEKRVIPKFCLNAIKNEEICIFGKNKIIDFLHISDAVRGIVSLTDLLCSKSDNLPVIQFASSIPVKLEKLAEMIIEKIGSHSRMNFCENSPKTPDAFVGSYQNALEFLGWQPQINLSSGLDDLIQKYRFNQKNKNRRTELL